MVTNLDKSGEAEQSAVGFPAFPATKRRPGRFARTWWGNAWLQAMEDTSLDLEQLKRGRRFAYAGLVGPITASPGRIAAQVFGEDGSMHHTVVFVDRLTSAQWRRFLDEVAVKAGHLAALLDKDMPADLVTAAADADVPLLPGIGDLQPECDCDGFELPCRHAAALCFQTSWLLDADPFVLLLLRGLGRAELTDELRNRAARRAAATPATLPATVPGVDPAELAAVVARGAERAKALLAEHGE